MKVLMIRVNVLINTVRVLIQRIEELIEIMKKDSNEVQKHIDLSNCCAKCECKIKETSLSYNLNKSSTALLCNEIDFSELRIQIFEIHKQVTEPSNELQEWLSKDEVIEYFRITPATYYRWINKGVLIPCSTFGEHRYSVAKVNALIRGFRSPSSS